MSSLWTKSLSMKFSRWPSTWPPTKIENLSPLRRQPDSRLEAFDNLSQASAQLQTAFILDAAILDTQSVEVLAVALGMPSQVRIEAAHLQRPRLIELAAQVAAQHLTELVDAP